MEIIKQNQELVNNTPSCRQITNQCALENIFTCPLTFIHKKINIAQSAVLVQCLQWYIYYGGE